MMLEPSAADKARCLDLRKRSKRGERLYREEMAFCARIAKEYWDWYRETEKTVFNETVSFGSNVRRE